MQFDLSLGRAFIWMEDKSQFAESRVDICVERSFVIVEAEDGECIEVAIDLYVCTEECGQCSGGCHLDLCVLCDLVLSYVQFRIVGVEVLVRGRVKIFEVLILTAPQI